MFQSIYFNTLAKLVNFLKVLQNKSQKVFDKKIQTSPYVDNFIHISTPTHKEFLTIINKLST